MHPRDVVYTSVDWWARIMNKIINEIEKSLFQIQIV